MTALDLRLFESSHIRSVLSAEAVRNSVGFLGFQATDVRAATCPLGRRSDVRSSVR
jgi:hypothetical protein